MKKLLIALTMILSVQMGAQTKEAAEALKEVAKAQADAQHPKKSTNPATWLKLSDAFAAVYDAPVKSIWAGANQTEVKLVLKDQRILNTEERTVNNETFSVDSYYDKDLYYSKDGALAAWVITKPYMKVDLLKESFDALKKAEELAKGTKNKDISERLLALKTRYVTEGMNSYTLGDFKNASANFEQAVIVSVDPIVASPDTTIIYYTGLTANMTPDPERAIKFFNMALDNKFDSKGDLYSNLAEAYKATKNVEKAKEVLGQGFTKYPTNQSILVSLINIYLETNDDPNKVLALIKKAQENEPTNASLHYAEGNVWKNLNNIDKAVECYQNSVKVDPNYVFGSFAVGTTYYDKAVEIQGKAADEMDDKKYEEMLKQLEQYLDMSIAPFEKCFELTQDKEIKAVCAEYLKNIYFRFREKGENYKAGYDKFNAYYESTKQQ